MDQDEYSEITSQLDAREILRYLNNLGIRNISGEVLKYFITDLKKLIKYDLQQRNDDQSARTDKSECTGPERLHSASTFSSRIRSKVQNTEVVCNRQCQKVAKSPNMRSTCSAPNLGSNKQEDKFPRRTCSCVQIEKKKATPMEAQKPTTNNNLIRVPRPPIKRKNDPVSLYHYYTSLWAKYKPNVPGENNWSELRWNIRQKMVGSLGSQTSTKVTDKHNQDRLKKTK